MKRIIFQQHSVDLASTTLSPTFEFAGKPVRLKDDINIQLGHLFNVILAFFVTHLGYRERENLMLGGPV